jgi:hypothetical protein
MEGRKVGKRIRTIKAGKTGMKVKKIIRAGQ